MLVCHPEVLESVRSMVASSPGEYGGLPGIPIVSNPHMPKHPTRWKWHDDPFFEYEDTDRDWCEFFGIGGSMQEDTSEFVVYQINGAAMWGDYKFGLDTPKRL